MSCRNYFWQGIFAYSLHLPPHSRVYNTQIQQPVFARRLTVFCFEEPVEIGWVLEAGFKNDLTHGLGGIAKKFSRIKQTNVVDEFTGGGVEVFFQRAG